MQPGKEGTNPEAFIFVVPVTISVSCIPGITTPMVFVEVARGDDSATANPAAADHTDTVTVLFQGAHCPTGADGCSYMTATSKASPLGTQDYIQVIFFHSLSWICKSKTTQKALNLMH